MESAMRNIAVVLAGGSGRRFGSGQPKQFLEICGRTAVEHCVDAFERNTHIDEIAVVVHPDHLHTMEELARVNSWRKAGRILPGGAERHLSTLSAINAFHGLDNANIILHDAARPAVSQEVINRVAEALADFEAVAVAIPAADTIFEVRDDIVANIPERRLLRCAQTPQAFRLEIIRKAYSKALKDNNFNCTDDCGIVLKYCPDVKIKTVPGELSNLKITYPEDLKIVEGFLSQAPDFQSYTASDFPQ